MWTKASRDRLVAIEKKTQRYPTDLTNEEWSLIEPLMPGSAAMGRKRHIAVDTEGRLLMVHLTPADISGSVGPQRIPEGIGRR